MPSRAVATALVRIFMFDAGMKSLSALREYNVSPRAGSTMRIPQCALANAGVSTIESISARSSAFVPDAPTAGAGAERADRHAEAATSAAACANFENLANF